MDEILLTQYLHKGNDIHVGMGQLEVKPWFAELKCHLRHFKPHYFYILFFQRFTQEKTLR